MDSKMQRDSNIELFRIITMILIVAHHYVTNSGLTLPSGPIFSNPLSWRSLFLLCFGAFGKIGINCFVLITGYFMCTSNISMKKYLKLIFEVMFYRIIIYCIFLFSGYEQFNLKLFVNMLIPISTIAQNFTETYLVFFLFIPFLNILIANMNEKQHLRLVLLLGFTYIVLGSIPLFSVTMNYVSWFICLYFTASYLRLYPKEWFTNTKIWEWTTLGMIIACLVSVIVSTWIGFIINYNSSYYFVMDSNKLLAVLTSIATFMFFKNLKIPYSPVINSLAASTFGVLLIHANSDAMRQLLWRDVFDCVRMYSYKLMPLYAMAVVSLVFLCCSLIDFLRRKYVEVPFFKWYDSIEKNLIIKFNAQETLLFAKIGVDSSMPLDTKLKINDN